MKKNVVLACLMLLGAVTATAQHKLVFFQGDKQLEDGEVIIVKYYDVAIDWEDINRATMESHLSVKNISGQDIEVGAMDQVVTSVPGGAYFGFCFGNCFNTPSDKTLKGLDPILAGELATGVHLNYIVTAGQASTAEVNYLVYDDSNPEVKRTVTVKYEYDGGLVSTSINAIQGNQQVRLIQSDKGVDLTYSFDSSANRMLNIYNVTGQKIETIVLRNETGNASLTSLERGLYIYSVSENGKVVATHKFVVR